MTWLEIYLWGVGIWFTVISIKLGWRDQSIDSLEEWGRFLLSCLFWPNDLLWLFGRLTCALIPRRTRL